MLSYFIYTDMGDQSEGIKAAGRIFDVVEDSESSPINGEFDEF